MTEDDAKTKMCPILSGPTVNADTGKTAISVIKCQGSGCALWRWQGVENTDEFQRRCNEAAAKAKAGGQNRPGDHQKIRSEVLAEMRAERVSHGACGARSNF